MGLRAPLGVGSRPGRPSTPSSPPPGPLHVRPLQSTARRAAPAVPRWDLPRSASKHRFAQGSVLSPSRPVARTGHLCDVSQHGRHLLPRPVFLPLSLKPDIVSSNSDLCPPTLKAAERAGEPPNAGAGALRATARSRGSSGPAVPRPVPPTPRRSRVHCGLASAPAATAPLPRGPHWPPPLPHPQPLPQLAGPPAAPGAEVPGSHLPPSLAVGPESRPHQRGTRESAGHCSKGFSSWWTREERPPSLAA